MDIATLPAIGWTVQRCPECRYEAFGQSRKAVLEAVLDHLEWKQLEKGTQAVFGVSAVGPKSETRKASA